MERGFHGEAATVIRDHLTKFDFPQLYHELGALINHIAVRQTNRNGNGMHGRCRNGSS